MILLLTLHTPACFSFTGGLVKAAHKKVLKNKTDSEILIYYNVNNPPRKIVKKLKSLAHAFCEWKWNATLNLNNKTNKEMKNCRNLHDLILDCKSKISFSKLQDSLHKKQIILR